MSPQAYLAARDTALLEHRSLQTGGHSPTGYIQHLAQTFALSYDRLDAGDAIDCVVLDVLAQAAVPPIVIRRSLSAASDACSTSENTPPNNIK